MDDLALAGAQRVIAQEVRALDPRRVRAEVVALRHAANDTLESQVRAAAVPVRHVAGRGLADPRRFMQLVHVVRKASPDVVHTHLTYANVLGVLAAWLAGRPAVASIHGVATEQGRLEGPKRWLQSVVLSAFARRVVVVSAAVLEDTARSLRLPRGRMVVLSNAVDLQAVRVPPGFHRAAMRRDLGAEAEAATRLVCTVGRLAPVKGHRFLIDALALLEQSEPAFARTIRLILVGDGPEADSLRTRAAGLGLSDRVAFLGNRSDVPSIVAACDLFVLPSLNEGLSQALLEAMALGTPVVATRVGGAADLIGEEQTGWLVPPADAPALARAMTAALADPRIAQARASHASRRVQAHFSLEAHVERLEHLYRSLLRPSGTDHA